VGQHFIGNGGLFYHSPVRCQVAVQHGYTTFGVIRVIKGADNLMVEHLDPGEILSQGFTGNRHDVCVDDVILVMTSVWMMLFFANSEMTAGTPPASSSCCRL
jgi:hypothetical protein